SVGLLHVVTQQVAAGLALALMALDLGLTLMSMAGLHERLEKARAWFDEVEAGGAVALDRADLAGSAARLRAAGEGAAGADLEPALRRAGALQQRYGQGLRLMRAFPALQLRETESEFEALRRAWTAQPPAGAKALVRRFGGRLAKARTEVAAAYCGVTATLLIWIFLIGNVTGYVVETVYCLIRNGHLESRQGLLYGPFSPVYGFGAVLMVLVLAPLVAKGNLWLFGGGAVIGGAFEVVCSLLQEALFGSVSWQYAGQPFALFGGRTGLVYMFLWGLLGLGYMRVIHPRIVHLVERLPGRPRRFFTVMIAVVLTADMLLSAAAVARWGERGAGLPPDNQADRLLDRYYPDEAMEQVYPNMEFLDG
ncbi:MAG: putative ABC transporter permease, partial [Propionibacteriaceae bacterium]|nr:putative ABC transporter permease [Propionibacteriaceae bacterium]